jgi:hypothetical protein
LALVIAWSFELTPQGLQRDPSALVDLGFRDFVDWGFAGIEYDPTFDSLRDDPRFKVQMKRIKDDLARQRVAAEAWRTRTADT